VTGPHLEFSYLDCNSLGSFLLFLLDVNGPHPGLFVFYKGVVCCLGLSLYMYVK